MSWTDRLARLTSFADPYIRRGSFALRTLRAQPPERTAIEASDGNYSYAEAAFLGQMIGISLRSRGFPKDWIAIWAGGKRRHWLPVMAAVGAADGVWCDGIPDVIPAVIPGVMPGPYNPSVNLTASCKPLVNIFVCTIRHHVEWILTQTRPKPFRGVTCQNDHWQNRWSD